MQLLCGAGDVSLIKSLRSGPRTFATRPATPQTAPNPMLRASEMALRTINLNTTNMQSSYRSVKVTRHPADERCDQANLTRRQSRYKFAACSQDTRANVAALMLGGISTTPIYTNIAIHLFGSVPSKVRHTKAQQPQREKIDACAKHNDPTQPGDSIGRRNREPPVRLACTQP